MDGDYDQPHVGLSCAPPLVDMHCHLLAGLDDGPATEDDAVEMCRMAWSEGTRIVAATAHQSEIWPEVTPDRIRTATARLATRLREIRLPLTVHPCAEVTVRPALEEAWQHGELLSVADRCRHLLVELPIGASWDLRGFLRQLDRYGLQPILAHPERHRQLLAHDDQLDELVRLGCLMQISSDSLINPISRRDHRTLRRWIHRGMVHLIGSDGHSPTYRPPRLARAYEQIAEWAGQSVADRICTTNALSVIEGRRPRHPDHSPGWSERLLHLGRRFMNKARAMRKTGR